MISKHMQLRIVIVLVFMSLSFVLPQNILAGTLTLNNSNGRETPAANRQAVLSKMGVLPASFIVNQGQVSDSSVKYVLKGTSTTVYLTDDAMVFSMSGGKEGNVKTSAFKMTLAGAHKTSAQACEKLPGIVNYFFGKDSSKWQTNIPTFARVNYNNVYSGVDMRIWGTRSHLKYEFHVAPGTDAKTIQIDYSGIEGLGLDDSGNLHIRTATGEAIDYAPFAYQDIDGKRIEVKVSYKLIDEDSYGFEVTGGYDRTQPLVIDPQLQWSRFLGGSKLDEAYDIAVDSSGNAYITGGTKSLDFPKTIGDSHEAMNTFTDAFVTKLNGSDGSVSYSTFIHGDDFINEYGYAITVDSSGNAYVAGCCRAGFPTTGGAYDENGSSGDDGFILKLTTSGSISYCTYLGGGQNDICYGIAIDSSSDIYVTGKTQSTDFPISSNPYEDELAGNYDAFFVKLSPDGGGSSDLEYGTYIGGGAFDCGRDIAVYSGDAFIAGYTIYYENANFPTTGGAYDTEPSGSEGTYDAFVVQISPDDGGASDLEYSTFLEGSSTDEAHGIRVDSSGNVYVSGKTHGSGFPFTSGAYDESHNGNSDVFVAKMSLDGNGSDDLLYSTFLGGSSVDQVTGHGIDILNGLVFVTGNTLSSSFPCTDFAYDDSDPDHSVFVSVLSVDGSGLIYSTLIGGSDDDIGKSIAVDSTGVVYVTGYTESQYFPKTIGSTYGGDYDGFVLKLKPQILDAKGGIYVASGSPDISHCEIKDNSWGIQCLGGSAVIQNNLIYDNDDGITFSDSGNSPVIRNNTIVYNSDYGLRTVMGTPTPNISNCILWYNGNDMDNCSATYSCIQDGDSGTGNSSSNPNFATGSYRLSSSSTACIDGGNPSTTTNDVGTTDLDGNPRIVDGDSSGPPPEVDMGAYEYQP